MSFKDHEREIISEFAKLISSFHRQSSTTELAVLYYCAGHLNTNIMTVAH